MPSMMESVVMRKCGVNYKRARSIVKSARDNFHGKNSLLWSKELERECLRIWETENSGEKQHTEDSTVETACSSECKLSPHNRGSDSPLARKMQEFRLSPTQSPAKRLSKFSSMSPTKKNFESSAKKSPISPKKRSSNKTDDASNHEKKNRRSSTQVSDIMKQFESPPQRRTASPSKKEKKILEKLSNSFSTTQAMDGFSELETSNHSNKSDSRFIRKKGSSRNTGRRSSWHDNKELQQTSDHRRSSLQPKIRQNLLTQAFDDVAYGQSDDEEDMFAAIPVQNRKFLTVTRDGLEGSSAHSQRSLRGEHPRRQLSEEEALLVPGLEGSSTHSKRSANETREKNKKSQESSLNMESLLDLPNLSSHSRKSTKKKKKEKTNMKHHESWPAAASSSGEEDFFSGPAKERKPKRKGQRSPVVTETNYPLAESPSSREKKGKRSSSTTRKTQSPSRPATPSSATHRGRRSSPSRPTTPSSATHRGRRSSPSRTATPSSPTHRGRRSSAVRTATPTSPTHRGRRSSAVRTSTPTSSAHRGRRLQPVCSSPRVEEPKRRASSLSPKKLNRKEIALEQSSSHRHKHKLVVPKIVSPKRNDKGNYGSDNDDMFLVVKRSPGSPRRSTPTDLFEIESPSYSISDWNSSSNHSSVNSSALGFNNDTLNTSSQQSKTNNNNSFALSMNHSGRSLNTNNSSHSLGRSKTKVMVPMVRKSPSKKQLDKIDHGKMKTEIPWVDFSGSGTAGLYASPSRKKKALTVQRQDSMDGDFPNLDWESKSPVLNSPPKQPSLPKRQRKVTRSYSSSSQSSGDGQRKSVKVKRRAKIKKEKSVRGKRTF